ncbi:MAG: FapA family protein [Desulfarculaceae bacterium]|nr:FapA family protein [Desulfarculaceae bacterium]
MILNNDIPTVSDLAYRYGTINKNDLDRTNEIYAENRGGMSHSQIMVNRKIATEYQVGLLKLIQDYYIIRKKGEHFGKIAVEKGFARHSDIESALEFQKREFKRAKLKKRIGDVLVENGTITPDQRDQIVAEQEALEKRAENLVRNGQDEPESGNKKVEDKNGYEWVLKQDDDFIRRVKEKGLASSSQISAAEKKQKREFEKKKPVSRIADILVKWNILTKTQKNAVLETLRSERNREENSLEKRLDIEVCETGMTARVGIDQKNGGPVELEDVKGLMAENGIVYGVFSDSVFQGFLDTGIPSFPVAGGDFPVEETGHVILYHFETGKKAGKVEKVKKGEALAELKLAEKNILGKDVRGNIVEDVSSLRRQPLLRPAAGAVFSENREKVFAGKTGKPALTVENKIYIHPGVNILEDADMRTGPLEKWADINVRGILSDAFTVKAGSVKAGEIRGTELTATGDVSVEIGITGAHIKAQGDIKARYLRNCTIETFGNVTVQNEIIDSTIRIGGKLEAETARILASRISAKKGIDAGAVGSDVTEPCELLAGREDLVVQRSQRIDEQKDQAKQRLQDLKDEWRQKNQQADQLFEKMKELKKFHDRTEKKKNQIKEKNSSLSDENSGNDEILKDLEAKLASIIGSLKTMNQEKKGLKNEKERLYNRIGEIQPAVETTVADLERDRLSLFKWAQKEPGKPDIAIRVSVKQDTVLGGIYSKAVTEKDYGPLVITEAGTPDTARKTGGLHFRHG